MKKKDKEKTKILKNKVSLKQMVMQFNLKKSSDITEKIAFLKSLPRKNFDETVELIVSVNKGKNHIPSKVSLTFPHKFGSETKVLVLCEDEVTKDALQAGADFAGLDEYVKQILEADWLEADVIIATPSVMPKIARLGKVLGTRGLMPNPKSGTVTNNVSDAVKDFKSGKKVFKEDKNGTVHMIIGKISMSDSELIQNLESAIQSIQSINNFSSQIKSSYIKKSMSPCIPVSIASSTET